MLCNEHRVATHRRLFSVIEYFCRSNPLCNKVLGVPPYGVKSLFVYVINVLLFQMKAASEFGIAQSFK